MELRGARQGAHPLQGSMIGRQGIELGLVGDEKRPESAARQQGAELRGGVQAAVKGAAPAVAEPPLFDGCGVGR